MSTGDSSCSEDDVLVPDTRELSCANYPEPQPTTNHTDSTAAASDIGPTDASAHSSSVAPSHVTLEALENTKVAVAQFAATALANGANEDSLRELAMLQSSLYTLQHQQVFQIQLIHQLQSQVTENATAKQVTPPKKSDNDGDKPPAALRQPEEDKKPKNETTTSIPR